MHASVCVCMSLSLFPPRPPPSVLYDILFATGLPEHDSAGLRAATLKYLENFDVRLWFEDPMQTIIDGVPCAGGGIVTTL